MCVREVETFSDRLSIPAFQVCQVACATLNLALGPVHMVHKNNACEIMECKSWAKHIVKPKIKSTVKCEECAEVAGAM